MKKTYTKPEILFENFVMSTSIATCEYQIGSPELNVPPLGILFTQKENCTYTPAFDENGDCGDGGICYHVVTNGANVFGS